jgi:hypothetical protein
LSTHDWDRWLHEWNQQLLDRFDPNQYDAFVDPAVTPDVIASGWLGFPGAGEEEIAALETRLGARPPPSYRSFLRASNGFLQPGVIVPRLLGTDEVDWFRVAHQATIDAWKAFEHHLPTALQVSAPERVGTAIYLLNPQVVDTAGEWEAFYFAHWVPGVRRYPSFRALMLAEQESWKAPPLPPPPSRPKTYWDVLRWIFRPG